MRAKTTRAVTAAALGLAFFTVTCAPLVPRWAEAQDVVTAPSAGDSLAARIGLKLRALPSKEGDDSENPPQLWIDEVSGLSARAGVQAGDVLVAVNGIPVHSIAQVHALVVKSKKSVALLIERDQRQVFVAIRL